MAQSSPSSFSVWLWFSRCWRAAFGAERFGFSAGSVLIPILSVGLRLTRVFGADTRDAVSSPRQIWPGASTAPQLELSCRVSGRISLVVSGCYGPPVGVVSCLLQRLYQISYLGQERLFLLGS
jgi:hypothetical protein